MYATITETTNNHPTPHFSFKWVKNMEQKKVKPPLTITQVSQAKLKITVQKTGKSYYRVMNYAKHIIRAHIGEPKEKNIHEYFLRDGCGWKQVTEEEFKKATTKEAVQKLHEQLSQELKQRVEGLMSKE